MISRLLKDSELHDKPAEPELHSGTVFAVDCDGVARDSFFKIFCLIEVSADIIFITDNGGFPHKVFQEGICPEILHGNRIAGVLAA